MLFAGVTFVRPAPEAVTKLNSRAPRTVAAQVFGAISYLKSEDSRQYLYQLKPKDADVKLIEITAIWSCVHRFVCPKFYPDNFR